jgi:OmpA-OmpF porin, OOP family
MLKKVVTAVALVSAFGMVSSSAMAAKSLDSGFYVDGNLGWGTSSMLSNFESAGLSCAGLSCSKSGFAWGLGAGYQFMPNLAVDFDYLRTPALKVSANAFGYTEAVTLYANSFVLSAKGILPVGDGFSVYGKIGPAIQNFNASDNHGNSDSSSNSVVTLYLGLGAQYNITSNFYVGALGSYFMKRGSVDINSGPSDNYSPQIWDITANIGYMF